MSPAVATRFIQRQLIDGIISTNYLFIRNTCFLAFSRIASTSWNLVSFRWNLFWERRKSQKTRPWEYYSRPETATQSMVTDVTSVVWWYDRTINKYFLPSNCYKHKRARTIYKLVGMGSRSMSAKLLQSVYFRCVTIATISINFDQTSYTKYLYYIIRFN